MDEKTLVNGLDFFDSIWHRRDNLDELPKKKLSMSKVHHHYQFDVLSDDELMSNLKVLLTHLDLFRFH